MIFFLCKIFLHYVRYDLNKEKESRYVRIGREGLVSK